MLWVTRYISCLWNISLFLFFWSFSKWWHFSPSLVSCSKSVKHYPDVYNWIAWGALKFDAWTPSFKSESLKVKPRCLYFKSSSHGYNVQPQLIMALLDQQIEEGREELAFIEQALLLASSLSFYIHVVSIMMLWENVIRILLGGTFCQFGRNPLSIWCLE